MSLVIASSNTLQRIIRSHYPLTGDRRIATVLNARITPNVTSNLCISLIIDILWARSDESSNKLFAANHFVPLFVVRGNDYVTKTQEKKSNQFEISKKFQSKLEASNISTKKGRSVNFFNIKTKSIHNWLPKLPEKNKNGLNLLFQGVLPTSNIAVKTLSAVNQSSVPCPKLSTLTTVDFVDVKSKGRGETNFSNSTLLLKPNSKVVPRSGNLRPTTTQTLYYLGHQNNES